MTCSMLGYKGLNHDVKRKKTKVNEFFYWIMGLSQQGCSTGLCFNKNSTI